MKRLVTHFKLLKVSPKSSTKQIDQAFITKLQELQTKNDLEGTTKLKEAYFAVSDYLKTRSEEAELEQEISRADTTSEQTTENTAQSAKFEDNQKEPEKCTKKSSTIANPVCGRRNPHDQWIDAFFKDVDRFEKGFFEDFWPRRIFAPRRSFWLETDPMFRNFNRRMREFEEGFDQAFESLRDNEKNKFEVSEESKNSKGEETNSNCAKNECDSKKNTISTNQRVVRGFDGKTFETVSESSTETNGKKVTKIKKLTRDDKGVNTVHERIEDESGVRTKNYKVSDEEFRRLLRSREGLEVLALE